MRKYVGHIADAATEAGILYGPGISESVFSKINVPSESPHQAIKRETESAINKINAKPLSKNKFARFFQKMGRGIAKAGVKIKGGLRHAKAWLKGSPVG